MTWSAGAYPVRCVRTDRPSETTVYEIALVPQDDPTIETPAEIEQRIAETFDTVCRKRGSASLVVIDLTGFEKRLLLCSGNDSNSFTPDQLAAVLVAAVGSHLSSERIVAIRTTSRTINIAVRNAAIDLRRRQSFETCYFLWATSTREVDGICDDFFGLSRVTRDCQVRSRPEQKAPLQSFIAIAMTLFLISCLCSVASGLMKDNAFNTPLNEAGEPVSRLPAILPALALVLAGVAFSLVILRSALIRAFSKSFESNEGSRNVQSIARRLERSFGAFRKPEDSAA